MEPRKSNLNEKLISAELGKLWATYMGNSMSTCILSYFLRHVEDQDIKKLLENALNLSKEFQKIIKDIFIQSFSEFILPQSTSVHYDPVSKSIVLF